MAERKTVPPETFDAFVAALRKERCCDYCQCSEDDYADRHGRAALREAEAQRAAAFRAAEENARAASLAERKVDEYRQDELREYVKSLSWRNVLHVTGGWKAHLAKLHEFVAEPVSYGDSEREREGAERP